MIPRRGEVRGADDLAGLLADVAADALTGALFFPGHATLFLVEGEVYCAEVPGAAPLEDLLVWAGALTASEGRVLRLRRERMDQVTGMARASIGLDRPDSQAALRRLVEAAIGSLYRLDRAVFVLDPYAVHYLNVVASWPVDVLMAAVRMGAALATGSTPAEEPASAWSAVAGDPVDDCEARPATGPVGALACVPLRCTPTTGWRGPCPSRRRTPRPTRQRRWNRSRTPVVSRTRPGGPPCAASSAPSAVSERGAAGRAPLPGRSRRRPRPGNQATGLRPVQPARPSATRRSRVSSGWSASTRSSQ